MNEKLFFNSVLLNYIYNSKDEKLKQDFASVLKNGGETRSINELVKMSGTDFMRTNANEVMNTGAEGFGKDWVIDTVIIPTLLERVSVGESLFADVNTQRALPNANNVVFPVRGKRARMVIGLENADQPQNKTITTPQVKRLAIPTITLPLRELRFTVYFSDRLVKKSVIDIANYVVEEIIAAYDNSRHQILINGDTRTGANTNINIIDGDTTALPDGNRTDILLFDGLRKIALMNDGVVNADGILDLSLIRKGRGKMGAKGVDPKKLRLVPNLEAYQDILGLGEVETIERFGSAATVVNGVITHIDGIKIIPREELTKTKADGNISATATNNTQSQMLMYHVDSVLDSEITGLNMEESRYGEEGTTGMTASTEITVGVDNTQNNDSPTLPCALIVNIGLVA